MPEACFIDRFSHPSVHMGLKIQHAIIHDRAVEGQAVYSEPALETSVGYYGLGIVKGAPGPTLKPYRHVMDEIVGTFRIVSA